MVLLPGAMEKLCQLIAEWLLPAPFCVVTWSWFGAGFLKLAWPWMATPPVGRVCARLAVLVANAVAIASVNTAGRNDLRPPASKTITKDRPRL